MNLKEVVSFKNLISILMVLVSLIFIAYLNFALIRYWFVGEFNQNLASIEISYIQMAKFWVNDSLWQPLWYLGYPWHVFYTPLLPALEVLLHQFLNFSFAHAYRVLTGAGYVLVPVSVYLFTWQIGKSKTGALISALFYTFVPSIIGFFFAGVANDTLSSLPEPRRFAILVRWGEGPHTLALVFLPLFGLFSSRFVEKRNFNNLLLASFFLALTALTNAIALWAALLLLLAILLSEITKKSTELIILIKNLFLVGALTIGLLAFWYNLPFIGTFFKEGGGALTNWLALFPWGLIPLLAAGLGIFLVVKKITGQFAGLALSIFWFLMLFGLVFTYYASGENRLEYVPQVLRLNTEVDLALSVFLGVVVSNLFLFLVGREGKLKCPSLVLAVLVASLPIVALFFWGTKLMGVLPDYTRDLSASKVGGIEATAEYRVAKRLKELTTGTNQRVLAPGNYGFWLNFFEDVPQLRGALYQSSTHFWPDHIYYQVTNGADSAISLAWLKIANVGKLVYTTVGSAETYKDYKVPQEKFANLRQVSAEAGDIYFDVGLKNDSLAKVVDAKSILAIKKPFNAIDEKPILAYVAVLEQKSDSKLKVTKVSNSRWQVAGEVGDGEAVLFQQTYDSGWKVKTKAGQIRGWKIVKDSFDFMVLVPKNPGSFEIELVYGRPLSVYLGYLITLTTIGFIIRKIVFGKFHLDKRLKSESK